MASRPHRVRGSRESTSEQLAISNLPQPLSPNPRQQPSAKRVRHDGSASATTPTETNPAFSSSHLKTSFNTGIRNDTTHMPPGLPRSVRGLSMPGHNGFVRQGELNSLEDLLEWQWEQGGVLLMQQAQGTDGTLLSTAATANSSEKLTIRKNRTFYFNIVWKPVRDWAACV